MKVSMKSGLEGRNNLPWKHFVACRSPVVSMKSGLEGRNNPVSTLTMRRCGGDVSMKSGLEGRNNALLAPGLDWVRKSQ